MNSSLLNKFNLTLDQLSFDFIGNCSNKLSLERIIKVLRSGEEGLYPDLLKHAEIQLKKIDSNNKLLEEEVNLYKRADIAPNDWNDLLNDLKCWEKDIKTQEGIVKALSTQSSNNMPNIRSDNGVFNNTNLKTCESAKKESCKPEVKVKIKSFDDWNRFNVDEELAKIDIKDDLKDEHENQSIYNIDDDLKKAEDERAKGNEYFKVENYPYALDYYTKSIQISPSCAAYNNRAMTYIKLKMYKAAVSDCSKVLSLEPSNVKALYRRSTAYVGLADENSLRNAWHDLKAVLTLEPTNKAAHKEYTSLSSRLTYPSYSQQTDQLPVIYYGPSTSDFKMMPQSTGHYMWARSHLPTSYVPCRCNCATTLENPLCRRCGEENIRKLKLKAKNKAKSSTGSLNASEIVRICEERKTNLYVSPPEPPSSNSSPQITNVNSNAVGQAEPDEPILTGDDKCRDLANKAMERGDDSLNANDLNTALHYYSTSIKFCPQTDSLLKRAKTLIQMKRYPEAVCDCSRVLEIDSDNIEARVRRATAYSHMTEEASLKLDIDDLHKIKNLRGKKELNEELNELLELISKRKDNFVDPTLVQPDVPSAEPDVPLKDSPVVTEGADDYKLEEAGKKNKKKKGKLNQDGENGLENNNTPAGDDLPNGWAKGEDNVGISRNSKKNKKKKKKNTNANDEDCNSKGMDNETGMNGSLRIIDSSNANEIIPLEVSTSDVSVSVDEYKALMKKQNKKNKKKLKKLAIAESKAENDARNDGESVKLFEINDEESGCCSKNSITHKKTKKMKSNSENNVVEANNINCSHSCSNSIETELASNFNNLKNVSHSKLDKYFTNIMSNTAVNNEQTLTRFWTMWNEFKKCDIQYMYRCKTLLTLTPDLLRTAYKKKLDCQTLSELVDTIEFLAKTNPSSAAGYLSELPKISKFNNVKQKIEQPVIEKVNLLIDSIEKRQIHVQPKTKEAFL